MADDGHDIISGHLPILKLKELTLDRSFHETQEDVVKRPQKTKAPEDPNERKPKHHSPDPCCTEFNKDGDKVIQSSSFPYFLFVN